MNKILPNKVNGFNVKSKSSVAQTDKKIKGL